MVLKQHDVPTYGEFAAKPLLMAIRAAVADLSSDIVSERIDRIMVIANQVCSERSPLDATHVIVGKGIGFSDSTVYTHGSGATEMQFTRLDQIEKWNSPVKFRLQTKCSLKSSRTGNDAEGEETRMNDAGREGRSPSPDR